MWNFPVISEPKPSVAKIDKKTIDMFVPVDQYDVQDFNLNDAGWPRNDICQLARAQSMEEYNAIVSRLVERKQNGSLPDGLTDREAFDSIKPRFVQSANEVEQFIEFTNEGVMERVNAAYEKALKSSDNKSDTEAAVVDSPAADVKS